MAAGVEVPCESSGVMFRSYVVDVIPENGGEPCREFVTPDYEGEVYVDGQRVEEPCTRRCESVVTKTLVQETTAAAAETTTEAVGTYTYIYTHICTRNYICLANVMLCDIKISYKKQLNQL